MVFVPAFLALASPKLKASKLEKFKTNERKILVIRINTFTNALMFILRKLKYIPSGE